MSDALITNDPLIHEINLLQLADGTAIIKYLLNQLKTSFIKAIDYTKRKYLYTIFLVTHYLHISESNQVTEEIVVKDSIIIKSAPDNQLVYLDSFSRIPMIILF